ncbi:sensor histidine kinase [Nonomuraea roseoviolacea subsp. roseoviolacea]|uniref:histidine kinase n=1 Tax=Nonomuraea roseoviolacea subsp. carminata TaxID=160689 RepID=A0ABT1JUB8_9ACTN|nr:sensor histidine kinase [Nonomuraea roseoviolacea]MCP2344871.1 signal transduction histidine kinase [Nonomuraea roseoviolacea subsp. carminata]
MLRRLPSVDPLLLDVGLALLLFGGTWLWAVYEPGRATRPLDAVSVLLTAIAGLPLALRRRAPFTVLVVSTAAAALYHALGYNYGLNSMGPLLALYTVTLYRSTALVVAGAVLVTAEWAHAGTLHPGIAWWSALGQALVVAAIAVCVGTSMRLLALRTRQLTDLAVELHREQATAAAHAATQERVRIARELHDVVAHHMSVISVQAGMGRYVALSDPATAHATLEVIADTSHEALTEMRRILSILRMEGHPRDDDRDDGADLYAATPGLARLEPLVERVRMAGPAVETRVEGAARPLPPGLDLCAYRIIQESLTNVLKHARAARVEVVLAYGPEDLTIRVTDDGAAPQPASGSTGHGLMGMTERVRLYGGTITAGPLPEGGFDVRATFPLPVPDGRG